MKTVAIENATYKIDDFQRVTVQGGESADFTPGLERPLPEVFHAILTEQGIDPQDIRSAIEGKDILVRGAGAFSLPMAWAFREMGASVTVVSDFQRPTALENALGIIEYQNAATADYYYQTLQFIELLKEAGAPYTATPMTYYKTAPDMEFVEAMRRAPGADPVVTEVDKGDGMTSATTFNAQFFSGVQLREFLIDKLVASGVKVINQQVDSLEPDHEYDATFTALGMGHRDLGEQKISATLGQILAVRDPDDIIKKSEGMPRVDGSVNLVKIYLDPADASSGIVLIGATKEVDQNVAVPTEEAYRWLSDGACKVNPNMQLLLERDELHVRFRACGRPVNAEEGLVITVDTFDRLNPENPLLGEQTGVDARVSGGAGWGNSINWGVMLQVLKQTADKFQGN